MRLIMKPWVALLAIFILAASASDAVVISGTNGKNILANLQNTSNKTIVPNNSSDFWSWGTVPQGHVVQNGSIIDRPLNVVLNAGENNGSMETPAQAFGWSDIIVNGIME